MLLRTHRLPFNIAEIALFAFGVICLVLGLFVMPTLVDTNPYELTQPMLVALITLGCIAIGASCVAVGANLNKQRSYDRLV